MHRKAIKWGFVREDWWMSITNNPSLFNLLWPGKKRLHSTILREEWKEYLNAVFFFYTVVKQVVGKLAKIKNENCCESIRNNLTRFIHTSLGLTGLSDSERKAEHRFSPPLPLISPSVSLWSWKIQYGCISFINILSPFLIKAAEDKQS